MANDFEHWWERTMGERMSHSKYLAHNAWDAALDSAGADDLQECLDDIQIIASGYDGYCTDEGLMELIDELRELAATGRPVPIVKEDENGTEDQEDKT